MNTGDRRLLTIVAASLSTLAAAPAMAQWTATVLDPAGTNGLSSAAGCVGNGVQGGTLNGRATLWFGSPGSSVDLQPALPGVSATSVYGFEGSTQVGLANTFNGSAFIPRACSWNGSAASFATLHPGGAGASAVLAINGGRPSGYVQVGSVNHAALWAGLSPTPWTDLNPAGASRSEVRGAGGGNQVGVAYFGTFPSAALWTGTAASFVNLTPASGLYAEAYATDANQQVGYIYFAPPTNTRHATLWTGSAASAVDLHPAGAIASDAFGVGDALQVGSAYFSTSNQQAGIWRGTAGSWHDLHQYLPSGFESSRASSVSKNGETIYVVGTARPTGTFGNTAVLWTFRPACRADFNGVGGVTVQDIFDFLAAYFAGSPTADFNGAGGITVQDIFDFLSAYFAGC